MTTQPIVTTTPAASGPNTPAFFDRWMEVFSNGMTASRLAGERIPGAKDELNAARAALENIEAQVIANGGTADNPIDGKNEAQRKAQLTVALENMDAFKQARVAVREAEMHIAEVESDASQGADMMRQARLALEYATAWMHRQAAMESGRVLTERTGR